MPGRVLPEARMCRWQPSARQWDMIRKTRPESTSPRWIPHRWTRQTTSYSNPYNGNGCGTQNIGQKAVPFLLLLKRKRAVCSTIFIVLQNAFKNPFLKTSDFKLSIRISPTVSCLPLYWQFMDLFRYFSWQEKYPGIIFYVTSWRTDRNTERHYGTYPTYVKQIHSVWMFWLILSPVFYCFFNILRNFAHCNISLAKRSSSRSPGNEVCTLSQKYGTDSGYYE